MTGKRGKDFRKDWGKMLATMQESGITAKTVRAELHQWEAQLQEHQEHCGLCMPEQEIDCPIARQMQAIMHQKMTDLMMVAIPEMLAEGEAESRKSGENKA